MDVEFHEREHIMALQQAQASATGPTGAQRIGRYLYRLSRRLGDLLSRYWAHMLTGLLGLIVCIALLIPILSYLGLDVPRDTQRDMSKQAAKERRPL